MARKKKAKTADRRTPTSRSRQETVPVSSRAQESLTTLLGQLATEDSQANQGCWQDDEKRLLKKVTQLHDGLQQLGFHEHVIRVILVNGITTDWNLESALDWACLHLSTQVLPSFLTDNVQAVDTMLQDDDSQRLTVVAPLLKNPGSNETILIEQTFLETVSREASSETRQTDEKDEQDAAIKRAWLLAQYEYDDSDNSNESLQEQFEEEGEQPVVLSPEEIRLGESQ
jgi:hypothetical protein